MSLSHTLRSSEMLILCVPRAGVHTVHESHQVGFPEILISTICLPILVSVAHKFTNNIFKISVYVPHWRLSNYYCQLLVTTPVLCAPTISLASRRPHRQCTAPSQPQLCPIKSLIIYPTQSSIASFVNQLIRTFVMSTIWSTIMPFLSDRISAVELSTC